MGKDKKSVVKGLLMTGAAVVLLGGGMVAGATFFPTEIPVTQIKYQTIEVEKEVPVEVEKIVEVEKVVKEIEIVEVKDEATVRLLLEHIYDNDGNIEYLIEDLDEDEIDAIVDRIMFVNDIKAEAENIVTSKLFKELDRYVVDDVKLDDRDMRRLRLDKDGPTIEVLDFDDKDADVKVSGTFQHDGDKYSFEVLVLFEDGKYDDLEIIEVLKE
jgi:hypothetical protein